MCLANIWSESRRSYFTLTLYSNEETLKNEDGVRKVYVPLLLICCPSVMTN